MPTSDTSTQAQAEATAADPAEALSRRNADVDFKGQKRTNATHASTNDAEARLYRKGLGKEARLSVMGHALTENRDGLMVGTTTTFATGTAECKATPVLPSASGGARSSKSRSSGAKTIDGLARPMLKGVARIGFRFMFTMAGYNLVRRPNCVCRRDLPPPDAYPRPRENASAEKKPSGRRLFQRPARATKVDTGLV